MSLPLKGSKEYDIMLSRYEKQIWQRHPEESDKQYELFRLYLESGTAGNRSVKTAYKIYCEKHGLKVVNAPMAVNHWSNGRTGMGKKIEGLHTYIERGTAFDTEVFSTEENPDALLDKRKSIVEQELKHSRDLLSSWETMYRDLDEFVKKEKTVTEKANAVYDPSGSIKKFTELVKLRETISVFARKAVGLDDKSLDREAASVSTSDSEVEIKWSEPKTALESLESKSIIDFEKKMNESRDRRKNATNNEEES